MEQCQSSNKHLTLLTHQIIATGASKPWHRLVIAGLRWAGQTAHRPEQHMGDRDWNISESECSKTSGYITPLNECMSFICHIHNYTEYNEEWNVFSAFNPSKCTHLEQRAADCAAPWEQSWTSCRSRDSNPQPWVISGFKSNALSIRPTTALYVCM